MKPKPNQITTANAGWASAKRTITTVQPNVPTGAAGPCRRRKPPVHLRLTFLVLLVALPGCASMGRRLTLPGSYLKPPATSVPASGDYEMAEVVATSGETVVTQFGQALDAEGRVRADWRQSVTVLFAYGNRMSIAASQPIFSELRRSGVNVMLFDYPGYGMSGGTPSEAGCYAACEAAYHQLVTHQQVLQERIVPIGLSLGCGVALELSTKRDVAGVVLVVPFTRTRDVGTDNLAWYLRWAVPLLARGARFDNLSKLPGLRAPLLLVSASRDQLTSEARTQQLLQAAHHAKITHVRVEADHNGAWQAAKDLVFRWLAERQDFGKAGELPPRNNLIQPTSTAVMGPAGAGPAPVSGVAEH